MILVVGSSNTDLVLGCEILPKPGETVLGGELHRFAGGKGANQAVAAVRAGAKVAFVGARGDDDFGKAAAVGLAGEGIDVRHFKILPDCASGTALILVGGPDRENMIVVAKSANDVLSADDVHEAEGLFQDADAVMVQLEVPLEAVMETAELAHRAGVPLILNPAPARPLPGDLLKLVHTITPNVHEAHILTGRASVEESARALLDLGVRNVIVTQGVDGASVYRRGKDVLHFPAPRVQAVDTVGAGDCFNGWLAAGLAQGWELENAVRRAVAAASIAVTRPGAQSGMPLATEVPGGQNAPFDQVNVL